MAYNYNVSTFGTFPTGAADIERYQAVRLVNGEIVDPAAAGRCIGVVDDAGLKQGQAAKVQIEGIAKVECSGTIAVDAEVTVDANGKVSAAAGSGEYILGQAIEAGVAGQIISVLLIKNTKA